MSWRSFRQPPGFQLFNLFEACLGVMCQPEKPGCGFPRHQFWHVDFLLFTLFPILAAGQNNLNPKTESEWCFQKWGAQIILKFVVSYLNQSKKTGYDNVERKTQAMYGRYNPDWHLHPNHRCRIYEEYVVKGPHIMHEMIGSTSGLWMTPTSPLDIWSVFAAVVKSLMLFIDWDST